MKMDYNKFNTTVQISTYTYHIMNHNRRSFVRMLKW